MSFTHIAQKPDDALRPVDAHQHDLVAEQDLQGDEHQDLTGATDHLVPHPEEHTSSVSLMRFKVHTWLSARRPHLKHVLRILLYFFKLIFGFCRTKEIKKYYFTVDLIPSICLSV